ncbi:endolytic transglycosylase MltG [Bacillus sp. FJAT-49732]|uniref:Endolytic transglycosylase MltG n=1 Tax=Lederbergia citrisecunda TaxID=2833583 RepID=A0A942TLL4_9BACI|nr:endolytic transglycosylase MltG [Lederbergia citrisecunda]MBS4199673.1 endolytic transglycosylase MltG [Lederbergia citrisecunda]
MNKQTTRAFASGLLISALILYVYVHFFQKKPEPVHAIKEGYIEMKQSDYDQLKQDTEKWQTKYETLAQKKVEKQTPIVTEKTVNHYEIVIPEGMSSKDISIELEDAGIIDNAENFNKYLAKKKLQRYIQFGTFELNDTMSYEEICHIIAKKP